MDRIFRITGFIFELFSLSIIVLSPTFLGAIVGFVIMLYQQTMFGIVCAGILTFIGLVIGVIWAVRIRRTTSATLFLGKRYATPDIDEMAKERAVNQFTNEPEKATQTDLEKIAQQINSK